MCAVSVGRRHFCLSGKKKISREAASLVTEEERGLKTTLKTLGKVKDEGSALAANPTDFCPASKF